MRSLKIPEGEPIEARMVTRSIENAQRKVEARNFDIRKQLLEYDDVAQRPAQGDLPAEERAAGVEGDLRDHPAIIADVLAGVVREAIPPESVEEQWDVAGWRSASRASSS
jgi:preprotein translocase subunit SecA